MNKILWGSASAAYQIEGAYQEDGKGLSIWDEFANFPGNTYKNTNGNIACDHYHRYKEDIALMKECGLQTYRFSISWSRILPNGRGPINAKGLQFYKDLCQELINNGIEPLVTLYHWDLPLALQTEYEGFESYQIIEDFVEYAKICFHELHDYVKTWIIMNEPNIFTQLGYLLEKHPPKKNDLKTYLQAFHHTAMCHAKTVLVFKELGYEGKIGSSIAFTPAYSASNDAKDLKALEMFKATTSDWYFQSYYKGVYPKEALDYYRFIGITLDLHENDMNLLKEASQCVDFIGVNYYQSACIAHNPLDGVGFEGMNTTGIKSTTIQSGVPGLYKQIQDSNLEYTDWDWVIDPQGLKNGLLELHHTYHLPILISENGLGAYDTLCDGNIHDEYRIEYLKLHILALKEAMKQGVKVLAYCTWSFTDLLSWLNGYQKRYGLVFIHFDDELQRIKKDSFYWYKKVIETNGEEL